MKVLWVTVGAASVASSRVRGFQMSAELASQGVQSRVIPLGGGTSAKLQIAARLRHQDVVVLQKVTPSRPVLAVLRRLTRTLVWDCDDAIHLGYPGEQSSSVARRKRRIDHLLACADIVSTTNELLASDLHPRSGRTLIFPGPAPEPWSPDPVRDRILLWLGSPSTEGNLSLLSVASRELADRGWRCVAVGAGDAARSLGWDVHPWSRETEKHWLSRASVGVMPMIRDPWSDRKAGYKILEYLAAGVVPVASDVPAAHAAFGAMSVGVLVGEHDSWAKVIGEAHADRDTFLEPGRQRVEQLSVRRLSRAWLDFVAQGG